MRRLSVTIKDILRVQMGFKCLPNNHTLMSQLTCKGLVGINNLLLICVNTLWLDVRT